MAHYHPALSCLPPRDTSSIPVPRTEPGTSWALSKPLGERVMGEASVSLSRKGDVHSRQSSGSLPHPSPTRSVSLGAERTRKAGNGGDGHRSEWRAGRGESQGIAQGWAAVSFHTWCPSLHHGAGQDLQVQLLNVMYHRCIIVRMVLHILVNLYIWVVIIHH